MKAPTAFRAGDALTLLAAAALTVWLAATTWRADDATRVVVRAGGRVLAEVSLPAHTRILAPGPLGVSVIEIAQRRARVAADPSPRQICVKQGWLARAGDAALCLPNQVSVELTGSARRFDSLAF